MTGKLTYRRPLVFQTIEVLIEQDLLQGPSSMGDIKATGQEVEKHNEFKESDWID